MHPARSLIFLTVASGAGYGMIVSLAGTALLGAAPRGTGYALVAFGLALALVVSGLLASIWHLGHPERAWRALSQWRSSWLSREGVAALITFVPVMAFAVTWLVQGPHAPATVTLGLVSAAGALATVYCTSMIYASLRPVAAWHNGWTVLGYLVFAVMTGAVLNAALLASLDHPLFTGAAIVAVALLVIGSLVKLAYWKHFAVVEMESTVGTATGLAAQGTVRALDPPHTEDNYLLREMGFRIARKHSRVLRRYAITLGFAVPLVLILAGPAVPSVLAIASSWLAVLSVGVGIAIERWLFFAEAKHAVTLYYDRA
ncbi:MAG: dimethyl sulfoxide reductase anchor subunit [Alphaproteobacteria bacterium]|nr:dimethyl sulfoxide reductase anchor subunit [Alphaproteobacteria bacterium]